MRQTDFTNMATGHNRFVMEAELSSCVPCNITAPVLPRGGVTRNYQAYLTISTLTARNTARKHRHSIMQHSEHSP